MKPIRLRDFVRVSSAYFSVVGYRNEDAVKCFLRYVPGGSRKGFRKLTHDEATAHPLAKKYYRDGIFLIPLEDVDEIYKPEERIRDVIESDEEVRRIVEFFKGIPLHAMGVTGSRLIGLQSGESDVDFVMYGRWWFEAREMLKKGISSGRLSEPDDDMWEFIYRKRKVPIPFDIFVAHERRKYHRAMLSSTYFDLLYVRDYCDIYKGFSEKRGKKLGKATVRGKLMDDSLVFDYPAYYPIEGEVNGVKAVLAFTHTYVGQVFRGEVIEARGVVEEIEGEKYLIVGTKREVEDEYIVSLSFLEEARLADEFRRWES
ncbi:nucleotidyltransferase domain-containing protein [Archaeoglobus veneficus]|uniref:DNA polymerase beta domain protein region n=1 Tax=Archaeoglobus veneficus (strain DSM 11195 / SNP6) TaxID=693661 RepID=F2KP44_ARCVS|nr:nucleotidyltransferase domain-containing protein [Archaeoglobus veneficus]AEA46352.1 DNA polymerase beta domain protein region [Archaeoglobus veneficus SNP6]